MNKCLTVLSITGILAGFLFAQGGHQSTPSAPSVPAARSIAVPEGNGKPVLLDGIFAPGEWDDALKVSIHDRVDLFLKVNSGHLFLGLKFDDGRGVITDLWMTSDDKTVYQMHSSGQLGEGMLSLPVPEKLPETIIGYTKDWDANEIKSDSKKKAEWQEAGRPGGVEGYRKVLFPSDGKEYQIVLSKFGGRRLKVRLMSGDPKGLIIFPEKSDLKSTENWLELILPEIKSEARAPQNAFPVLKGPYLGQKPPGVAPEIFAPGILSRFSMLHGKIVFSPDGLEAFWTCNAAPAQSRWTARQTPRGIWAAPEPSFLSVEYIENSMVYSVDGKKLYFHSRRPLQGTGAPKDKDIWYREKTSKGWGDPIPLGPPVNLPTSDESAPSLAADGTLFFSRQESTGAHGTPGHGTAQIDIYYSEWRNGAYTKPVRMGPEINSEYPEIDPVIAPDKSYLLFTSGRPDGYSRMMNLYVSFRTADGRWTPAQCLSHSLKIDNIWFPSLSVDGAYLFFCGGYPTDKGYTDSSYYWVSARIIEGLRPKE